MSTENFFTGFIQGSVLVTPLDAVAAQWRSKREVDSGMSFAGDVGSLFLHIPWLAF